MGSTKWEPGALIQKADLIVEVAPGLVPAETWEELFGAGNSSNGIATDLLNGRFHTLEIHGVLHGKASKGALIYIDQRERGMCTPMLITGQRQILFLRKLEKPDYADSTLINAPIIDRGIYELAPSQWPLGPQLKLEPKLLSSSQLITNTGIPAEKDAVIQYLQVLVSIYHNGLPENLHADNLDSYQKDVYLARLSASLKDDDRHTRYLHPHP